MSASAVQDEVRVDEVVRPPAVEPTLPGFDKGALVEVRRYSDGKTSEVLAHLPMLPSGVPDPDRPPRFSSQVMLHMGPRQIPWNFEIDADTLEQALERVVEQGIAAGKKAAEHLEDQQRRQLLMGAASPTLSRQ